VHPFRVGHSKAAQCDPRLKDHPPHVEWFEGEFESGQTNPEHPLVQTFSAADAKLLSEPGQVRDVPYDADLPLFTNHANIPTMLYGADDVRLAHAVNEHIVLEDVVMVPKVLALTIKNWCDGNQP
jgi:acetylornithine deacetylase